MKSQYIVRAVSAAGLMLFAALSNAADWTQFRGVRGSGVSNDSGLPVKWSKTENLKWKSELPGKGLSCPVVADGRVFVTACDGPEQTRLLVLCFDAANGKKLWQRSIWATGNTLCHPKTNMAAPTPATDGKAVYALFATADLVAYDRDGNLLWYRSLVGDYPTITNQVGMASSPVLAGETLVVPMDNSGESFVAGIDRKTGKNKWKIDRPRDINWVTPAVRHDGKQTEIIFPSQRNSLPMTRPPAKSAGPLPARATFRRFRRPSSARRTKCSCLPATWSPSNPAPKASRRPSSGNRIASRSAATPHRCTIAITFTR